MSDRKRILIVEDESLISMMIEEFIESMGHDVVGVAANLNEAQKLLAGDEVIDGALLDCRLGSDRSWPVAESLQERGIPFLFMTGAPGEGFPDAFAGTATLAKPFILRDLERAVDTLFTNADTTISGT